MSPLVQRFVAHFGEMGGRWGMNRSVGQIFALLYASARPLNAEEITAALGCARSNTSMGLKELQAWRLVSLRHLSGDRRDYFETAADPWDIFRTLVEERRRREVAPTTAMLQDMLRCAAGSDEERHALERMRAMHEVLALLNTWYDDVQTLERPVLERLLRLGARVQRLFDFGTRMRSGSRARPPR